MMKPTNPRTSNPAGHEDHEGHQGNQRPHGLPQRAMLSSSATGAPVKRPHLGVAPKLRQLSATALSIGLLASGTVIAPPIMHPQAIAEAKTVFGNTDALDISTINNGRLVDVTFTLTGSNPFDEVPDGELPPAQISGYQVTISEVLGFDPRNAQDRARAEALTPEEARNMPQGPSKSALTDARGYATITGLKPGLYLVDTQAPQAEPTHKYKKFDPFLLMLPTGGIEGWDYVPIIALKEHPVDPPVTPTTQPLPTPSATVPIPVPVPVPKPHDPSAPAPQPKPKPQKGIPGIIERLPMTGAQVISVLVASLCFIAAGAVLLFFGRRRREESEN